MEESKRKIEKYMQEATERMNANDLDSAAFKVRKALEVLVKELCDEMEIEIKVKGKDRDSLNSMIGKIKDTNAETRVLKYDDIESMYKVKQVGNIGSHDDDDKNLEKATGEVKVRNAIDTMYLLLESLSDNSKLKLKVSVNTMLEDAKKDNPQPVEQVIVKPKGGSVRPVANVAKPTKREKKEKPPKQKDPNRTGNAAKVFKSIIKWDVLVAVLSGILYSVGGIKYAMYIGLAVMVLVDIILIAKARSNPGKKPMHSVLFIVVAALLIALTGAGSYFISPANAATMALKKGDPDSAKEIVQKKIQGNIIQETIFNRSIDSYYKETVDEYASGSINDDDVKKRLGVLAKSLNTETGKKAAALIKSIDAYNQGKAFYDSKNYTDAILMLSQVSKDFPKYDDAQDMIGQSKQIYMDDLFKKVGTPSTLDECTKALGLLNEAAEALPNENDISLKKDEVSQTYLTLLEKEVNARLNALDYAGANSLVTDAGKLLGNNETVKSLQALVGENQPKPLSSFHLVQDDNTFEDDEVIDTYGNEYDIDNSLIIQDWSQGGESYATYNIGADSKRIKGTIAVGDGSEEDYEGVLYIESNGVELFKQSISRTTKPIPIDLDVSNIDTITFKVKGKEVFRIGYVILGEIMVY